VARCSADSERHLNAPGFVSHYSLLRTCNLEDKALCVAKEIERQVTMAIRNCFKQRRARESAVFLKQHVRAYDMETSFIRIEFNAQPLFAGSIVHIQSNI